MVSQFSKQTNKLDDSQIKGSDITNLKQFYVSFILKKVCGNQMQK